MKAIIIKTDISSIRDLTNNVVCKAHVDCYITPDSSGDITAALTGNEIIDVDTLYNNVISWGIPNATVSMVEEPDGSSLTEIGNRHK